MGLFNSKPAENKEKDYKNVEGMAENLAREYYSGVQKDRDYLQDEHYERARELLRGNAKKCFLANEKFRDYFFGNHIPFVQRSAPENLAQRRTRYSTTVPVTHVKFNCRAKNSVYDRRRRELANKYSPYSYVSIETPGTLSHNTESEDPGLETISILDNTPNGTRVKRHIDLRRKGDGHVCRPGCNCWEDKIRSEYRLEDKGRSEHPWDSKRHSEYLQEEKNHSERQWDKRRSEFGYPKWGDDSSSSRTSDDSSSTSDKIRPYLYPKKQHSTYNRSPVHPHRPNKPYENKPQCETKLVEKNGEKYLQNSCSRQIQGSGITGYLTTVSLVRQRGGQQDYDDTLAMKYSQNVVDNRVRSDGFSDTSVTEGQFGGQHDTDNFLGYSRRVHSDGYSDTSVTGEQFGGAPDTDDIPQYPRDVNRGLRSDGFSDTSVTNGINYYGNQLGGDDHYENRYGNQLGGNDSSTSASDFSNNELNASTDSDDDIVSDRRDSEKGIMLKNDKITSEELVRLQEMMFRSNTASEDYESGSTVESNSNIYGGDSDDEKNDNKIFRALKQIEKRKAMNRDKDIDSDASTEDLIRGGVKRNNKYR